MFGRGCTQNGKQDSERDMIRRIGTLLALWIGCLVGNAQTTSGELSGTEVWSGEVRLTGDITIPFGASLTIQPGTKVILATSDDTNSGSDADKIRIYVAGGTLMAVGLESNLIQFESGAERTEPGQWYGIVCDLGNVDIRHVRISDATNAIEFIRPGFYAVNDTEILEYSSRGLSIAASGRYSFERMIVRGRGGFALHNSKASFLDIKEWTVSGGLLYVGKSDTTVTSTIVEPGIGYGIKIDVGQLTVEDSSITGRTKGIQSHGTDTIVNVRGSWFLNNETGIDLRGFQAEVVDSQFRGNNNGLHLEPQGSQSSNRLIRVELRGNVFEGNQGHSARILATNSRSFEAYDIAESSQITANAFSVSRVGLVSDFSIPEGVLIDNDFVRNTVHVAANSIHGIAKVVARRNYWGETVTARLDAGESVSSIDSFAGDVVVDDWASSSTLESVDPPPSRIEWDTNEWAVTVDESATIRLVLENADSFDYQWFKDGVRIQDVDGPSLEISNATLADAGSYIVVVSNEAGTVTSQPAVLSVVADPQNIPASGADSFHPADTNQDSRISIDEVTSYGAAWKNGRNWTEGPNPIPIDYLTRAGAIWKNGERYRKDENVGAAPLWWVNDAGARQLGAPRSSTNTSSPIVRHSMEPDLPSVTLVSREGSGGSRVRVVLPVGTTSWAIEGDGLREGLFWGDEERVITVPANAVSSPLLLSVDGHTWIVAINAIARDEPLRMLNVAGEVGLVLDGRNGLQRLQRSENLVDWSSALISHVREGIVYPIRSEGSSLEFYRLRSEHSFR